jgi:ABC-type glycerol-3-phosphate transport system substrate-binding protein
LAHSWVVSAATQNQEAANTWLEFVASDEYLRISIENGGGLVPARVVPEGIELPPSVADAAAKLEAGVGFNPSVYFSAEGRDAWYAAMQQLLTGQVEPAEAMANVQAALEEGRATE